MFSFQLTPLLVYGSLMTALWLLYASIRKRKASSALKRMQLALASGMADPPTLHPVIDPNLCLGCGSCVHACPEGDIIGLIGGKAQLVEPANCIGHGACQAACPFGAITLVFGTARRGVDIPVLHPNFETTMPGIYIAGELGGMGLIRNAITQGTQAVAGVRDSLAALTKLSGTPDTYDLVIVGAGPAGIAASLEAKRLGMKVTTIEQDRLGGTIAHFPRAKIVMTAPAHLPLVGIVKIKETAKEALLEFWHKVIDQHQPNIRFGEQVVAINGSQGDFTLTTTVGRYSAKIILLCLGRRGTPRKLEVPGEELSKVVYSLSDPVQYHDQRVLVVGGGDSALEAACSLADDPQVTEVTLCYRGEGFTRAKQKNRLRVDKLVASGRLRTLLNADVSTIAPGSVELLQGETAISLDNDGVIICAGGILPTPFLKEIGINVETKHGTV